MRVLREEAQPQPAHPEQAQPPSTLALQGLEQLHLVMGQQCNARCVMCYQTEHGAAGNMPAALYAERLAGAYPRVRNVKLQGGEPTVMRNCRQLAGLLRTLPDVGISLSTNGIRLDGFWHELLLLRGEKVDVSLNAASEDVYRRIVRRGDFRRASENIRALTAARQGVRPTISVSLVVLRENLFELHDFVELARELGADAVKIAVDPVLSFSGLPGREEVRAEIARVDRARRHTGMPVFGFESFSRRFGATPAAALRVRPACREPFRSLVVAANGDVRACVMTWEPLGNLYESSLEEIWSGRRALRLRARVGRGDHSACEPQCPDNPNPSRLALLRKYAAYGRRDPGFLAKKLRTKVGQLFRSPGPRPGEGEEAPAPEEESAAPEPVPSELAR